MAEHVEQAEEHELAQEVAAPAAKPEIHRKRRRPVRRLLLYAALIAAMVVGGPYGWGLWQYYQAHESTDDAFVVGDIIPVSARVNGTVLSVHVENHQQVEAGQVLARLEPRDFEIRVKQAEAAVAVARARLHRAEMEVPLAEESTSSDTARTGATLQATHSALREAQHRSEEARAQLSTREAAVAVARAEVDRSKARLDMARIGFERMQQLLRDGVVAQQQFDEADSALRAVQAESRAVQQKLAQAQSELNQGRADLRMQRQAMEQARARVAEAEAVLAGSEANRQSVAIKQAQVQVAHALLQQAQADLAYAKQQLDYTVIRAAADGTIAKNDLQVGQVVQAGRPLLAIVPLHNVWIEANFKETQLEHMRPGQKATLEVDAYPGQEFGGTVESISPGTGAVFSLLPPENATGNFVKIVQRVPVKIVLDSASPSEPVLRPGMSVIATVATR
jgi:membrane fusion protein (multidrug efflux system)